MKLNKILFKLPSLYVNIKIITSLYAGNFLELIILYLKLNCTVNIVKIY